MIRFFLLRIIVPLFLFLVVRYLLNGLFKSSGKAGNPPQRPEVPAGGELKRDPICGTYVATTTGLTCQSKGQTLYFCSKECRDKYRAA